MKLIITLLISVSTLAISAEAPYYRFWRGVKRSHHVKEKIIDGKVVRDEEGFKVFETDPSRPMSWQEFHGLVNHWLIPATTSCCAQPSLLAYLPVLTREGVKPNGLHDEIALIIYRSEKAYLDTRNDKTNREARAYGPLHGDVFDTADQKSRSLVPIPYRGTVTLAPEAAYDILETNPDWQAGHTRFRIHIRVSDMTNAQYTTRLAEYLSAMKANATELGVRGHLALIAPQYVIEYLNFESEVYCGKFDATTEAGLMRNLLRRYQEGPANRLHQVAGANPLRYDTLAFESAGTVVFEPGKKPNPKAHHHRMD